MEAVGLGSPCSCQRLDDPPPAHRPGDSAKCAGKSALPLSAKYTFDFTAIEYACHGCGATLTIAADAPRIHMQLSLVAGGLGLTPVPVSGRSIRVDGGAYRCIHNLADRLLEPAVRYYRTQHRDLVIDLRKRYRTKTGHFAVVT